MGSIERLISSFGAGAPFEKSISNERSTPLRKMAVHSRVFNSMSMWEDYNNIYLFHGSSSELSQQPEVQDVVRHLINLTNQHEGINVLKYMPEINLMAYDIDIRSITIGSHQPNGFSFMCNNASKLNHDLQMWSNTPVSKTAKATFPISAETMELRPRKTVFTLDNSSGAVGHFAGMNAHGNSFREFVTVNSLHIAVALDGKCNAHIDKTGVSVGPGQYSGPQFIKHQIDLGPEIWFLGKFYGSEGNVNWGPYGNIKPYDDDPFSINGGPGKEGFHVQNKFNEKRSGWGAFDLTVMFWVRGSFGSRK